MGTLAQITDVARSSGLMVSGVVAEGTAPMPDGVQSIVLLSPDEPAFWTAFTRSAEYADGAADPMDRWSERVIGALAASFGAVPLLPFGARPPHPFFSWAAVSGRVWASPVKFLVGARAGLWQSYRGALGVAEPLGALPPVAKPCDGCAAPCATACPVGALTPEGYDLDACHAYLDTPAGQACLQNGCRVRAACPVSQSFGRLPAQAAFHMKDFHP